MPRRVITMSKFGRHGRWGNQIMQYAFLKVYAKMHDLEVQIPPWYGNVVFGASDPPVTAKLPIFEERMRPTEPWRLDAPRRPGGPWTEQLPPIGDEAADRDWHGYGQYHTSWYEPHKEYVQSLFQPTAETRERMEPAVRKLAARKLAGSMTVIGIHYRLTDNGHVIFWNTPAQWYHRLLGRLLPTLDRPTVFVASDDKRTAAREFARYDPVFVTDLMPLGTPVTDYCYLSKESQLCPENADFYPEWHLLRHCCDIILAGGPVTYSFTAAWLSDRCRQFWRSDLPRRGFVLEAPWWTVPMTHTRCELYPDVPGLTVEKNPYWI